NERICRMALRGFPPSRPSQYPQPSVSEPQILRVLQQPLSSVDPERSFGCGLLLYLVQHLPSLKRHSRNCIRFEIQKVDFVVDQRTTCLKVYINMESAAYLIF